MNEQSWWEAVLTGGKGHIERTRSGDESMLVLPNTNDPRVLVDPNSPVAVREAVRRFASTRSLPTAAHKVLPGVGHLATRFGPSWNIVVVDPKHTLRAHLSDVLGAEVRLSIAVGPRRPNRKPVVRCYAGETQIAVAKLGPETHTADMVRNESEWLRLWSSDPLEGVVTPRLLHHGVFGPNALLVMSSLDLGDEAATGLGDMPNHVLAKLHDRFSIDTDLSHSPYWTGLLERLSITNDEVVANAIAMVTNAPAADSIVCTAWHGDWSPWNVAKNAAGEWAIWDWERSAVGAPLGFDQLHLAYQYGAGIGDAPPALAGAGVPEEHHATTSLVYLLELAARHHEAGSLLTDRHRKDDAALRSAISQGGDR